MLLAASLLLTYSPEGRAEDSLSVVMRFGGDVLLAARYEEGVGEDIHRAFAGFDLFQTDDVSVVNLECPITTRGTRQKKPFTFRMHRRFLPVIEDAGIEVVNLANNHIYDFGKIGLFDTIEALDNSGVRRIGAGRNSQEAHQPVVLTVKGKRIGLLGYYGPGESPAATRNSPGVAPRRLDLIRRDIQSLNQEGVEFIVVNFHWGTEKARYPDVSQTRLARAVIDAGANAVIGHHPHVLQGIERHKHGVIVYSLGNLIFGGNSRHTYATAVFEIRLDQDGKCSYDLIPVQVTQWNAAVMSGSDRAKVLDEVKKLSQSFSQSIFN